MAAEKDLDERLQERLLRTFYPPTSHLCMVLNEMT